MASSGRRSKNGLLLPLALGATAAAASFALWYFLSDEEQTTTTSRRQHSGHESSDELRRSGPTTSTGTSTRRPGAPQQHKKNIALVVRESSTTSSLLRNLPTPLPLDRANVFILIFSPSLAAHPLSDSDGTQRDDGRTYRQARRLYPKEAPRELVMPYTDPASLAPMLKQLAPEAVYIEAGLAGEDASALRGVIDGRWVGSVVIAVEDGVTGQRLADATGEYGKRCVVVDVAKAGDDWMLRVG